VGFVVDKVALGQVFLQVLRFAPASIIPPLLHIHLSLPHEVYDLVPKLGLHFDPALWL
jgi:branched-subunit amino acid transport protein